jgi:hypothetical protein
MLARPRTLRAISSTSALPPKRYPRMTPALQGQRLGRPLADERKLQTIAAAVGMDSKLMGLCKLRVSNSAVEPSEPRVVLVEYFAEQVAPAEFIYLWFRCPSASRRARRALSHRLSLGRRIGMPLVEVRCRTVLTYAGWHPKRRAIT